MKILVFGTSHVVTFKLGYDHIKDYEGNQEEKNVLKKIFAENEINFIPIQGPNFKKVLINKNSNIVEIPRVIYDQNDNIMHSFDFDSFDSSLYDLILWVQGQNLISIYHEFIYRKNSIPNLLSFSLQKELFNFVLRKNQEFAKFISDNLTSKIAYVGSPVMFLESKPEKDLQEKFLLSISLETKYLHIHKRNIEYLYSNNFNLLKNLTFLLPPQSSINPFGQYTYNNYKRRPNDYHHGNYFYGIEQWQSVVDIFL